MINDLLGIAACARCKDHNMFSGELHFFYYKKLRVSKNFISDNCIIICVKDAFFLFANVIMFYNNLYVFTSVEK
jgi:hypothetical protein